MTRIYTPQSLAAGQEIELEPQASHHLSKVLRVKVGEQLQLFNGDGNEWLATITAIGKKSVKLLLHDHDENSCESSLRTHLAICVSKGDRMDFVLQKATELGVTEITPLLSQRTGVKLNAERWQKKQLHWQQICISACEQSGRAQLPKLNPVQTLTQWLASDEPAHDTDLKLILHPHQETSATAEESVNSVTLLIGPEGGFSEEEIQTARKHHFRPWQLGRRILRTETAPLVALSILQFRWGDLSA